MTKKRVIKRWRLIKSKVVFNHPWYKVGKYSFQISPRRIIDDYYLGISKTGVYIAAFTPERKLILVRQYKPGADAITLDVPAGYLEKGESPLQAAKRELLEETGYRARSWKKIAKFYSDPTKTRKGVLHFFIAKGAYHAANQHLDSNENIEVRLVSQQAAIKKVETNNIQVTASALIILLALKKYVRHKRRRT